MSTVTTVTNPPERLPAAPPLPAAQRQLSYVPQSFSSSTTTAASNPFATANTDVFFARNHADTDTNSAVPPERAGLFGAFAGFMDKKLVRYAGYFNEIAASLGHSYHPKKHYNPNQWWKNTNPNWFKGLNAATWVYAGLDVFAKAGEAYKRTKADPNSDQSATSAAVRTGVDRALFQTAATIILPVKIIGKLQKMIDKGLKGKVSAKALGHAKFFGTFLPIPLIAAFVDGGTNMLMDMTVRPLLGTPKHIIDTHGKPGHGGKNHGNIGAAPPTPAPASSLTENRSGNDASMLPTLEGPVLHPTPDMTLDFSVANKPLPVPDTSQPVVIAPPPKPQHTRSIMHPFAPNGTNFLSGDAPSPHYMRANIKFNQFAFE